MSQERDEFDMKPSCELHGDRVSCRGEWTLVHLGKLEKQISAIQWPSGRIHLMLEEVSAMDTAGAWLLHRSVQRLRQQGHEVVLEGLAPRTKPLFEAIGNLGDLSAAAVIRRPPGPIESTGRLAAERYQEYVGFLSFLGQLGMVSFGLLLRPVRFRWKMLLHFMGAAGYKGMPIVGLLSFLLGVVIAYQGGVQLRQYGANIFIADLVGIAMVRELSPLLSAIIIAGRTGSAFAAQIGTMKVTEEIDALRSIGIDPLELIALPRVLALMLALPLLTVFADAMGLAGGMLVGGTMLGISPSGFIRRVGEAVSVTAYLIGIGKAPVFAAIIGWVGCYQGFQVAGSAESVGQRTTMSVVQAIFLVIVVDAAFSVLFTHLGL